MYVSGDNSINVVSATTLKGWPHGRLDYKTPAEIFLGGGGFEVKPIMINRQYKPRGQPSNQQLRTGNNNATGCNKNEKDRRCYILKNTSL